MAVTSIFMLSATSLTWGKRAISSMVYGNARGYSVRNVGTDDIKLSQRPKRRRLAFPSIFTLQFSRRWGAALLLCQKNNSKKTKEKKREQRVQFFF